MANGQLYLIDGLKHMSQIHRSQFDERRRTEWKIVFTILAFYIGIIVARINGVKLPNIWLVFVVWIFLIVLAYITIRYLQKIHESNHTNKMIARKAEDAIVKILNGEKPILNILPNKNQNEWKDWQKWSWYWQSTMISFIAIFSAIIISF